MVPDPVVPTDPEVPEAPVPDATDPVAGASTLSVDDVSGVPVALADAEWLGDAEWPGDDDPVDLTVGLAELLGVVLGVVLRQPPDGVTVTVCSAAGLCVGLGFGVVVVGFGVGVVLPLPLGLGEVLALALGLALLLALTVLVGLAVLRAGLLEWSAVLVFAAAFDELGEATGDDEQVEAAVAVLSPSDGVTWVAPFPSAWPPPVPGELGAELDELKPDSTEWKIWLRSGGTAASTTPTANTARPTASAGRSIASRQSPGRCGACRAWDGPEPCPLRADGAASLVHSRCQRLSSPARKPEIAALRDWVAVA